MSTVATAGAYGAGCSAPDGSAPSGPQRRASAPDAVMTIPAASSRPPLYRGPRSPGGGGVALVEDEIDDLKHGLKALGELSPGALRRERASRSNVRLACTIFLRGTFEEDL